MKHHIFLLLLLCVCLLLGCAPKEAEIAEMGEDYAHFYYDGTAFYLDYTAGAVSVIPSHFLPVGELILSEKEDDLCGNAEGTVLMSEGFPDFAYVLEPGSEEFTPSYSIFRAKTD